jgi:hypothetical protein
MNQSVAYELRAPHEPLGETMDIQEVVELLGCSAWTVRNRYLALGLPHLRVSPRGKLIFFREQITRWIFERQTKGGF